MNVLGRHTREKRKAAPLTRFVIWNIFGCFSFLSTNELGKSTVTYIYYIISYPHLSTSPRMPTREATSVSSSRVIRT